MTTDSGPVPQPPGPLDRLIARIVARFTGSATAQGTGHKSDTTTKRLQLRYFEDVLPVELMRINKRRERLSDLREMDWRKAGAKDRREAPAKDRRTAAKDRQETGVKDPGVKDRRITSERDRRKARRGDVQPLPAPKAEGQHRRPSPDPDKLFNDARGNNIRRSGEPIDPAKPDLRKTRPRPVPSDVTGLALSGGGIRSAAVCLGALQALHRTQQLDDIDYLSTVSGGGYMGTCLSAGMLQAFPANRPTPGDAFPFGDDIADNAAMGHLRNFSNYLLPRGRSGLRNYAEVTAVLFRGLLANATQVLLVLLLCALLTMSAFPVRDQLHAGSFLGQLVDHTVNGIAHLMYWPTWPINHWVGAYPFSLTYKLLGLLGLVLLVWAVLRTFLALDKITGDTRGFFLFRARELILGILVIAFLDAQPLAIAWFIKYQATTHTQDIQDWFKSIVPVLVAFSGAVSALSSALGHFLEKSEHTTKWTTLVLRLATKALLLVAALALPLALWLIYLYLCAFGIQAPYGPPATFVLLDRRIEIPLLYSIATVPLIGIYLLLRPNSYSLHRFYRDRLSRAFVFFVKPGRTKPTWLDDLKLSALQDSLGPYHIINAAMNVQGSAEANKRGRDADFFMFTPDFIGSDLTMYGPTVEAMAQTPDMEKIDKRLDLATAMAISGAAVSANMGSNTVRLLSPTLALLNIRLGYWLRNPRHLARDKSVADRMRTSWVIDKSYLLLEMLNLLDETSRNVYLTDGGHIENLGAYELLKRGCKVVIVIDAEADPSMSFGSLLKLERYARIDLGVRIILPWEEIARRAKRYDRLRHEEAPVRRTGPHCAIGRIIYENNAQGVLIYFKSSVTGDEKDYILDYKKRFPAFPHVTTGDQFFTEEQFEAYRALGFHMVNGVFQGDDEVSYLRKGPGAFTSDQIKALKQDFASALV